MSVESSLDYTSQVLRNSVLDDSQKQFCSDPSGAIRLLAPAGSGKTYSLLWRCLYLNEISNGEDRFLIFTFTRAARDELRDRLKNQKIFKPLLGKIEITTLNSWGYRRLRGKKHSLKLFTTGRDYYFAINNVLQPIWQKYEVIKATIENTRAKGWIAKNLIDIFDRLKRLGFRHDQYKDVDDLTAHIQWLMDVGMVNHVIALLQQLEDIEIIYINNNYNKNDSFEVFKMIDEFFMPFWREACDHLYKSSIITLEDQKYWALIDLEQRINEKKYTTGIHRYHHILVDEFQDINVLDLNLLKAIAKINKADLTIVGDDDQSIFEWRGASPHFIINPDKHIKPGYKTHILKVNYRSPKNIVEYSQKLISHNKNRVPKKIIAKSSANAKIVVKSLPTFTDTLNFVVTTVKKLLHQRDIQNVAIIGRKRSQIIPYQIIFASENIPFYAAEDLQLFLSEAFHELKEMLAIKARAKLGGIFGGDPVNDLIKLCNKVKRYPLNKKDLAELKKHLYHHRPKTLEEAVNALIFYTGNLKGENKDGQMSLKFATAISELLKAETVSEAIDAISENFDGLQKDYGKSLEDIFYADPPFLYLSDYAERYGNDYESFYQDIERAIGTLARVPSEDEEDTEDDSWKLPLHLMTALRAKGKEFDAVFILDANHEIWPSKLANSEYDFEQERRLFYVAFTRARKQLYIMVNKTILGKSVLPSPYLAEMGLKIEE